MLSLFARILLTATAVAPVLMVFATYFFWDQKYWVGGILIGVVVFLVIVLLFLLSYCNRTIERIKFDIVSIESADREYVSFLLLYLSPLFFSDLANINWSIIVASFTVFAVFVSTGYGYHFNPLLGLCGYHFYKVSTAEGVSYVMVTKKKLITAKKIFTVGQLTDYIVLDFSKDGI